MSSTNMKTQLLDTKLAEIRPAKQFDSRIITELRAWIETADDYDLFMVNPIQFAKEKSISQDDCIDLFLYTAKYGLFEMDWHMLCAFCSHIVDSLQELNKVHSHFICNFCGAENNAALDDYIHVSFTLSPQIRQNAYLNPDSLDAVTAAMDVFREIAAFNATISDEIILKFGIHRGHAIVVALNDRLDFFGQTVNIAARVQGLAGAGDILLSADVHDDPGVQEALRGREVAAEQVDVRGVRDRLDAFRVSAQH